MSGELGSISSQLGLDAAHMADLRRADTDHRDRLRREAPSVRPTRSHGAGCGSGSGVVDPLEVEQRRGSRRAAVHVDRLDHESRRARRSRSRRRLSSMALADNMMMAARARAQLSPQLPCDFPAVMLGHREIEQDEVRVVHCRGQRRHAAPARRDRNGETKRRQQLAHDVAMVLGRRRRAARCCRGPA